MGWLTGWERRKQQTITGSTAGAQTNYQKKMTVHKGAGEDSATDVYCGGNCRDDFRDIRWTEDNGTTEMDFWVQDLVSGDKAVFWVEIPSIPESPSTVDIYMYYDKSDASTDESDGSATFPILFDDFNDNSLDESKWNVVRGTVNEVNQRIEMQDRGYLASADDMPDNAKVIAKYLVTDARNNIDFCLRSDATPNGVFDEVRNAVYAFDFIGDDSPFSLNIRKREDGSQTVLATTTHSLSIDTWYDGMFCIYGPNTDYDAKCIMAGTELNALNKNYSPSVTSKKLLFYCREGAGVGWAHLDNVAVGNYIYPEPAFGDWGSEETPSQTATINSNARVKVPKTETINGNARIKVISTKTITGTARIKVPTSKSITGNARISELVGWLTGWNKRKKQTITGSTVGAQTNYQMKMTVHKGSGEDSATDVYCGGNCRDDFGDIRWATEDGTTLMDYWIEKVVSGDYAVFWIEIPSIPVSPDTVDCYMYYDKSDATSISSGDDTFEFFDDFPGAAIDDEKWDIVLEETSTVSVADGILTATSKGGAGTWRNAYVTSKENFGLGTRVEILARFTPLGSSNILHHAGYYIHPIPPEGEQTAYFRSYTAENFERITALDGSATEVQTATSKDTEWHIFSVYRETSTSVWFQIDSLTPEQQTATIPTVNLEAIIRPRSYGGYLSYIEADWVRVRKCVTPEPTWGTWGSEAGTFYKTVSSNARIKITQPKTITGNAKIILRPYKTITANARIKKAFASMIDATARIKVPTSKTITGNATVVFRKYETIGANARIKVPTSKIIQGNARIKSTISKTITGNARIKIAETYYKTVIGNARIESIQRYDTQLSYRFDREYKVRAIAGVANSIGYEWWVNEDGILCFFNQRGHDKSATITLSDDITEVDQSFDATKIIDKLTVVGMGPGSTHLEVTVGTGEMEGTFTAKNIHDIDTLTSFANAALEQTKQAKHRMIIKLVGTERTDIELGDIVHATHIDAGIDGDYRIISMERVSGVAGDLTKLEIAVPQFRVTETLMNLDRRADAEDYHPQGAPSILTLARADNVDSTHPLKMKFYVPPEAVDMGKLQIKEARVALTLEKFRAYSTGAAAGGQQTTSSGGGQTSSGGVAHSHTIEGQTAETAGDHRHKMFHGLNFDNWSDPVKRARYYAKNYAQEEVELLIGQNTGNFQHLYTYVAEGSHSHPVSGTTSSSESSHTHTVSDHTHSVDDHVHDLFYGIFESTSPTNVYIKLNGVQIAGPFNADEFVDITTEFLNEITTYGWNTLEFTSAQLGKIGATLFMRLFLQAS